MLESSSSPKVRQQEEAKLCRLLVCLRECTYFEVNRFFSEENPLESSQGTFILLPNYCNIFHGISETNWRRHNYNKLPLNEMYDGNEIVHYLRN